MGQKCVVLEHLAQGTSGVWASEFPVLAGEPASGVGVLIGDGLLGSPAVAVEIALLWVRVHGVTKAMIADWLVLLGKGYSLGDAGLAPVGRQWAHHRQGRRRLSKKVKLVYLLLVVGCIARGQRLSGCRLIYHNRGGHHVLHGNIVAHRVCIGVRLRLVWVLMGDSETQILLIVLFRGSRGTRMTDGRVNDIRQAGRFGMAGEVNRGLGSMEVEGLWRWWKGRVVHDLARMVAGHGTRDDGWGLVWLHDGGRTWPKDGVDARIVGVTDLLTDGDPSHGSRAETLSIHVAIERVLFLKEILWEIGMIFSLFSPALHHGYDDCKDEGDDDNGDEDAEDGAHVRGRALILTGVLGRMESMGVK